MKFIKKIVPKSIKVSLVYGSVWLKGKFDFKKKKYLCNICNRKFSVFAPYNNKPNRMCPHCFSLERHRLLYEYLKKNTGIFESSLDVLHFAPESSLHKVFKKNKKLHYVSADLLNQFVSFIEAKPDLKMSVTDIQFGNDTFDIIICNHVLEHVKDDIRAMREIFRVLKHGGMAILMVPADITNNETLEDDHLNSEERRTKYGSPDHVRLYGETDYMKRLESVGFKTERVKAEAGMNTETLVINKDEPIYIGRKA